MLLLSDPVVAVVVVVVVLLLVSLLLVFFALFGAIVLLEGVDGMLLFLFLLKWSQTKFNSLDNVLKIIEPIFE
jgi:hypothetical protein